MAAVFPIKPVWEQPGSSRIPFWAYTDESLYKRELERLFYQGHWCYVGPVSYTHLTLPTILLV